MLTHRNILVGTDFSERADVAVQAALELARAVTTARVTLVHVVDTSLTSAALPYDLTGEAEEARLEVALDIARDRLRDMATGFADVDVGYEVRRGNPARELARAAAARNADLIVTSTQGHGALERAILGSVTHSLLGYAACPVLVVGKDRGPFEVPHKVMAAVDLSPVSAAVLEQAMTMATLGEGGVRVVSVFDEPFVISGDHPFSLQAYALPSRIQRLDEQKEAVTKLVAAMKPEGMAAELTVVPGAPPHLEVLDLVAKTAPDLVVVGASGHRTWSKALFGTNASRIISGCRLPVLVVPDPAQRPTEGRVGAGGRTLSEEIIVSSVEPDKVRGVLEALVDANVEVDHISVVMNEDLRTGELEEDSADEGFLAGSAVGTAIGGVLGGLASLAVGSGIGLVVMGPAVALGLVSGLIGTLVSYGVPVHEAARLQDQVERGKVLVAVHAHSADEVERAKTGFADAGAQPAKISTPVR